MLVAVGLGALWGCESHRVMDPEQPCLEAGFAIASRTYDCTDDGDLANARYEAFEETFECIPHELTDDPTIPVQDLFHCGYVIRTLSCDEADAFGDELAAWLQVSPACNLVVEYADGTSLKPYAGFVPDTNPELSDPVCSDEEGAPVSFSIDNVGPIELALYWLQPGACTEIYYAPLRPNDPPITQSTFEGHVWVVRDPTNDKLYDWFVAEADLQVVVP